MQDHVVPDSWIRVMDYPYRRWIYNCMILISAAGLAFIISVLDLPVMQPCLAHFLEFFGSSLLGQESLQCQMVSRVIW